MLTHLGVDRDHINHSANQTGQHGRNPEFPSASDITQAEKSWMSRLRNPKLATIGQGRVYVGLWREGMEGREEKT